MAIYIQYWKLFQPRLKLVGTNLNYRVLGTVFLSNDRSLFLTYYLRWMSDDAWFHLHDSVDLQGTRGKRQKYKIKKFFPTVELEHTTLKFVARASTD